MAKRFIHYDVKNGIEYASVYTPRREMGKKVNDPEYLGRVIDKERGIYQSRARGLFAFSLEHGYGHEIDGISVHELSNSREKEKLILDFGDAYCLYFALQKTGLHGIIHNLLPGHEDTLMSLVGYKLLASASNRHAEDWWTGSYTSILFPKARIGSQRISEFYRQFGKEEIQREFFKRYLNQFYPNHSVGVLIDSTGLPNDIHFPLTAINTHNGVTSNETRLLLVVEQKSGMPLFFRYNAGNIVDVTTLRATFAEMKAYNIQITNAIVDAGYYSEANIRSLYGDGNEEKIPFITRIGTNLKLYKTLLTENADDLTKAKYLLMQRDRLVSVKRVEIDLFGNLGYAYVILDHARRGDEVYKYARATIGSNDVSPEEMDIAMRLKGFCIIISSEKIDTKDILPLYYTRQAVEQVFDVSKNYAELLPLRVHNEETFRGHILLSFITTAAFLSFNQLLKGTPFNAEGAFMVLRNQKCKVFNNYILTKEANKKMNEIYKKLGINLPLHIPYCGKN
jgi:hypothetical protein